MIRMALKDDRHTRPSPSPPSVERPHPAQLPEAHSREPLPDPKELDLSSVRITLSRGTLTLNGKTVSRNQLASALQQVAADDDKRPIEILCDQDVDSRVLESLKVLCKDSGLRKLYVTRCDIE